MSMETCQLVSYIAPAAPATRRPARGDGSWRFLSCVVKLILMKCTILVWWDEAHPTILSCVMKLILAWVANKDGIELERITEAAARHYSADGYTSSGPRHARCGRS